MSAPIIYNDSDIDAAVRTVYGEARGESFEGQIAVAYVIKNRATWQPPAWWGHSIASVCHHPYQFSCWNPTDPNSVILAALSDTNMLYTAIMNGVVKPVMAGAVTDPTGASTHYKVRGTAAEWDGATVGMVPVSVGAHDFYQLGPNA